MVSFFFWLPLCDEFYCYNPFLTPNSSQPAWSTPSSPVTLFHNFYVLMKSFPLFITNVAQIFWRGWSHRTKNGSCIATLSGYVHGAVKVSYRNQLQNLIVIQRRCWQQIIEQKGKYISYSNKYLCYNFVF